ncbi:MULTISPECIES: ChaN family lipoprotein [Ramlibacter]|uniref:Haem-binding uptake Tiki superfamily ChaN domain-containing protein n=1 Tax=Ramlibacter pinisoli TaxID=2682844 RepID=A0A6N8J295_9BURK|nr:MULTISPECIES: ChaN family lipoprotein [Ramlibacter]MBA2962992.1 ChaN family lipoprotein [Ramlibacter sp. CGMCC 1.13660]MVQ32935.1 hypothetical protein [Ramlibacter pinisoli]
MSSVRRAAIGLALLALAACAPMTPRLQDLVQADVVLLGELHDDAGHQSTHRQVVQEFAGQGRLAALALEMAEEGTTTAGLPPTAGEATVLRALRWNDEAWPWDAYGPAVMAAVAAGVPVLGANLPRAQLRAAMADASLDDRLDAAALAAQREAIRTGHCDLLPTAQLGLMVRVQVARDLAMARTIESALVRGRTVVLLAGSGHVDPALGVPRHLPPRLVVRSVRLPRTADSEAKDYCAGLRRQIGQPA